MGEKTGILWTSHTFNPWWGCAKVSSGCLLCYADTWQNRWDFDTFGFQSNGNRKPLRTFAEKHWREPVTWNAAAQAAGVPARVFCASMGDVFDDHPQAAPERERLWALIRQTPWLHWQLLTKRPQNIPAMLPEDWGEGYPNVWLGTSVESVAASARVALLAAVPARVRFLSCEPLLGELELPRIPGIGGVHWVILGGESGHGARRMDPAWLDRALADLSSLGISAFVKQTGAALARELRLRHSKGEDPAEWPERWQVQTFPVVD